MVFGVIRVKLWTVHATVWIFQPLRGTRQAPFQFTRQLPIARFCKSPFQLFMKREIIKPSGHCLFSKETHFYFLAQANVPKVLPTYKGWREILW